MRWNKIPMLSIFIYLGLCLFSEMRPGWIDRCMEVVNSFFFALLLLLKIDAWIGARCWV